MFFLWEKHFIHIVPHAIQNYKKGWFMEAYVLTYNLKIFLSQDYDEKKKHSTNGSLNIGLNKTALP